MFKISRDFIRRRSIVPIAVWLICYLSLFLYAELVEPQKIHLIYCALDGRIPYLPGFIYPYLGWFPYIAVCTFLAMRNLEDTDYKKAVFLLSMGMNLFLLISFLWPTGLELREGISYNLSSLSGKLMYFVQTVDAPRSVFPSMHVYVTLVLQYTLEMQRGKLPSAGILWGRAAAVAIILSTMFTKQHSVIDVAGAIVLFGILLLFLDKRYKLGYNGRHSK